MIKDLYLLSSMAMVACKNKEKHNNNQHWGFGWHF
jgi:hypothetical protein